MSKPRVRVSKPTPGETFSGQGFEIRVIDINDFKNLNEDGTYKRSSGIIYEYLTGPVGKIGRCKTIEGFHYCWQGGLQRPTQ
jgi:hypothetical protein